jgi:hypothetical protein
MLRLIGKVTCLAAVTLLAIAAPGARAQFLEPDVTVLTTLTAEAAGDSFGFASERIGDIDLDGVPDYVIGAPFNGSGGTIAGRAYVYSGADGTLLHVVTGNPFDTLGWGVAGGGDFDADGIPDYAIGAPARFGVGTGRVLMISGADHSVIHDIVAPTRTLLGFDVNVAGDVDGDGYDDLVAGAVIAAETFTQAGQVVVFSGRTGETLWTADGQGPYHLLGSAVTGLDDLNGDGIPELGAGAFGAGDAGTGLAYVLNGADGAFLRTLVPNDTAGAFGQFFIHDAGDVNADGVRDIYVGDFGDSHKGPYTGRGYVYSGRTPGRIRLVNGENAGDGLGIGRGAGDVDGDGHADLVLAAYLFSGGAPQGGKVYVFSGRTGQVLRSYTGTTPSAQLGFDAVALGDVNADGSGDYLITGRDVAYVVAGTPVSSPGGLTKAASPGRR